VVRRLWVVVWLLALVAGGVVAGLPAQAASGVWVSSSRVRAVDGEWYSVTNHLVQSAREKVRGPRREWLLAWSGDESSNQPFPTTSAEPDFLAVVDATKGSPTFGRVVNTVTVDSVFGNEPHHLQYQWSKGDRVYAGGLLSDVTYVFDVSQLPEVRLSGVTPSSATPCGSVPDAYHVLEDGSAYATFMGGPDVAGPCTYTNGETRVGNGFGGTPGEIVRIGRNGKVLSEAPAASTVDEAETCDAVPALPLRSCANPHGMAVREDLDRMVTGDFVEARNLLGGGQPTEAVIVRNSVRIFDISKRQQPKLKSVSYLPKGPRFEYGWWTSEPYAPMEAAVTHGARNRGAFVSTTGGAVFYTPDITARKPVWREVFDDLNAFTAIFGAQPPTSSSDGGSWLYVSPDDRFLYRIVLGGGWDSPADKIENGMLQVLDIRALVAAGNRTTCSVDTIEEVSAGGAERDCPRLVSAVPIKDDTSGGPHWATLDTFGTGRGGLYHDTGKVSRIATTDYFVEATGIGGDHRVCLFNVSPAGRLAPEATFRDEVTGETCLNFNRTNWPHGATGNARPHGVLFAVADRDIR
jgi:hypothetical protein